MAKVIARADSDGRRILIGARYVVVHTFGTNVPHQWEIVRVLAYVRELPQWLRVERLQRGARKTSACIPAAALSRNTGNSREYQ